MAYAPGSATSRGPSRGPAKAAPSTGKPKVPTAPARRPTVTFLAGLGIGLALGAAAALLLAPQSGAETRRALRSRGKKVKNKARDAWDDLRIEIEATRRALKRKRRDARMEIEEERTNDEGLGTRD
jgi:gas vesicle protein